MLSVLAPVLALTGLGAYVLVTTRLGIWRRHPWEFLALTVVGVALGLWQLYRAPGVGSAIGALASVAIAAFVFWFIFSYSMFGAREDRPRPGDAFPDFALPASDGTRFSLADAHGRRLLLLFYRGAW